MFNLGALHSQVAKGGSATDGEGQKTAIDMLQKSATYFKELKAFVEAKFAGGIPSPDLEPGQFNEEVQLFLMKRCPVRLVIFCGGRLSALLYS